MRDHFGVGFGRECGAVAFELLAQLAEILDDAVVHDRHAIGRMGMRVDFVRPAVRCPARVADADGAGKRLTSEPLLEVAQLPLGTPPRQVPLFQGSDASGIIAAILEPLERFDHLTGHRLAADNAYDPTHRWQPLLVSESGETVLRPPQN